MFGWEAEARPVDGQPYTVWKLDGRVIGGMLEMNEQWPAEVPPFWGVSFAVGDCDATVTKAQELGGSVNVPAMTTEVGRFAVLADPQGAGFGVTSQVGDSG